MAPTDEPWSTKPCIIIIISSSSSSSFTCTAIRSPHLQAFGTKHLSKLEREMHTAPAVPDLPLDAPCRPLAPST